MTISGWFTGKLPIANVTHSRCSKRACKRSLSEPLRHWMGVPCFIGRRAAQHLIERSASSLPSEPLALISR